MLPSCATCLSEALSIFLPAERMRIDNKLMLDCQRSSLVVSGSPGHCLASICGARADAFDPKDATWACKCSFVFGEPVRWGGTNKVNSARQCCNQCRDYVPKSDDDLSCNGAPLPARLQGSPSTCPGDAARVRRLPIQGGLPARPKRAASGWKPPVCPAPLADYHVTGLRTQPSYARRTGCPYNSRMHWMTEMWRCAAMCTSTRPPRWPRVYWSECRHAPRRSVGMVRGPGGVQRALPGVLVEAPGEMAALLECAHICASCYPALNFGKCCASHILNASEDSSPPTPQRSAASGPCSSEGPVRPVC